MRRFHLLQPRRLRGVRRGKSVERRRELRKRAFALVGVHRAARRREAAAARVLRAAHNRVRAVPLVRVGVAERRPLGAGGCEAARHSLGVNHAAG